MRTWHPHRPRGRGPRRRPARLGAARRDRIGHPRAGDRLPPLRELAAEIGVNANTLRAAYAKLEADRLIETRHGSGTFVAGAPARRDLSPLVDAASRAAHDAGIDPRDLAAALYVSSPDKPERAGRRGAPAARAARADRPARAARRRTRPGAAGEPERHPRGPRILTADELESVRAHSSPVFRLRSALLEVLRDLLCGDRLHEAREHRVRELGHRLEEPRRPRRCRRPCAGIRPRARASARTPRHRPGRAVRRCPRSRRAFPRRRVSNWWWVCPQTTNCAVTPSSIGASRSGGVTCVMISSSLRGEPWAVEDAVDLDGRLEPFEPAPGRALRDRRCP